MSLVKGEKVEVVVVVFLSLSVSLVSVVGAFS